MPNKIKRGFSTLELMVALAIFSLAMSATLMLGIGQASSADSEMGREALLAALTVAEEIKEKGEHDFRTLHATTSTYTLGSTTYSVAVKVEQESFFIKSIRTIVSWSAAFGRTLSIEVPSLVADYAHAVGGSTCYSEVDANKWRTPNIKNSVKNFAQIISGVGGVYTLASVDAYKGILYVVAQGTGEKSDATFFTLDIENPNNPLFLASVDTSTSTVTGLSSVRVAEDTVTGKTYAFVANNYTANFSSCLEYYNCAQLQIVDVTDPQNLSLSKVKNYKIPGVTGAGGAGKSIFYDQGYVYLGLAGTGGNGPEFHIIDVRVPLSPQHVGSYEVGKGVGGIYVHDEKAYLATEDLGGEVVILDVGEKSEPTLIATYDARSDVTNFGYGKSIDVVGDRIYLGRTFISNAPEFQILDGRDMYHIPPPPLGVRDVGPSSSSPYSANSILIRDTLAFVALGSGTRGGNFQILNVKNPASITPHGSVALPSGTNGGGAAGMDCERDTFFIVSNDVSKKGYLSVIAP